MVKGGKQSPRAGYYVHIEPGNCMVGGGIWCPEPSLLKALRKDVYDNIDEFTGILRDAKFQKYYVLSLIHIFVGHNSFYFDYVILVVLLVTFFVIT